MIKDVEIVTYRLRVGNGLNESTPVDCGHLADQPLSLRWASGSGIIAEDRLNAQRAQRRHEVIHICLRVVALHRNPHEAALVPVDDGNLDAILVVQAAL